MDIKLRQKLLKELKSLLNEQVGMVNLKDLEDGVSRAVTSLDGLVTAHAVLKLKVNLQRFVGKKVKDRKGNIVPAIQLFSQLYQLEENGDKIEEDLESVGTRTMSRDGIEAIEDIKEILSGKGINPATPSVSATPDTASQETKIDTPTQQY